MTVTKHTSAAVCNLCHAEARRTTEKRPGAAAHTDVLRRDGVVVAEHDVGAACGGAVDLLRDEGQVTVPRAPQVWHGDGQRVALRHHQASFNQLPGDFKGAWGMGWRGKYTT